MNDENKLVFSTSDDAANLRIQTTSNADEVDLLLMIGHCITLGNNLKSPERTERDRYLAIVVTDLEKVQSFVKDRIVNR